MQLLDKNVFKELYVNFCKEINYPAVVSAGGALLMMGLRETTSDLDLDVSDEIFDKFLCDPAYKDAVRTSEDGTLRYIQVSDYITIHRYNHAVTVDVIEGVVCYCATDLLAQKMSMDRARDQEDISNLQMLLWSVRKAAVLCA